MKYKYNFRDTSEDSEYIKRKINLNNSNFLKELFLIEEKSFISSQIIRNYEEKYISDLLKFLNKEEKCIRINGWTISNVVESLKLNEAKFDDEGNLFILDKSKILVLCFNHEEFDKTFLSKIILLMNI